MTISVRNYTANCPDYSPPHQAIGDMAEKTNSAWKSGSYCSLVTWGVSSRITSAFAFVFQVIAIPAVIGLTVFHTVKQIQFLRKDWDASQWYCAWIAIKISVVSIGAMAVGIVQSAIAIVSPEFAYTKLKLQKLYYSLQIRRAILLDNTITKEFLQNLQTLIRQTLGRLGFDLEPEQFRKVILDHWITGSCDLNSRSLMGNPRAPGLVVLTSFQEALKAYLKDQLDQMLTLGIIREVEHRVYGAFLTIYARMLDLAFSGVDLTGMGHFSIPKPPEQFTMGKILFEYIKAATKDLVERMCFEPDEIEGYFPGAYNSVVGLAVFRMISDATLSEDNTEILLKSSKENLKLDSTVNTLSLKEKFISLKKDLIKLEEGRKGEKAEIYELARSMLIDNLSSKEINLETLRSKNAQAADLEAVIFKKIGEFIPLMNNKLINSATTTPEQKINWNEVFLVSEEDKNKFHEEKAKKELKAKKKLDEEMAKKALENKKT
jgi:hypothetical protein